MFFNVVGEAGVPSGNPANLYSTVGVAFDEDRLHTSGADLTGNADSKLVSGSFFFRRVSTGGNQDIWHSDGDRFLISISSNLLRVRGNSGSVLDLQIATITDTDSWHHLMFSVDMADTGKRHSYLDGVSTATWATYVNSNIDFTRSGHAVGSVESITGFNDYKGNLADFWLAFGQYIDLSLQGNRERFIDGSGKPVDLGSDGSKPTGTPPLVFFKGDASVWNAGTNLGSAQNFTMGASVTDASSSPSD